jgi:ribosomal-protein-alanine acetyltransferase
MPKCLRRSDLNVRLRRANSTDIPATIELELQSSSAAHWTREQYESRIAATNSERSESLVLVVEGEDAPPSGIAISARAGFLAFLVARGVDKEWELENIVVAENARRRGIGFQLLRELIEHAKRVGGTAVFLEVRESNQAARGLYHKMGFVEVGKRNRYYSNPSEDAIFCRITL